MAVNDEYLFGLKYWSSKVVVYRGHSSIDTFLENEMAFDAICFCLINLSDIAKHVSKEAREEFSEIDFPRLENLAHEVLNSNGDYINIELFDEVTRNEIPKIFKILQYVRYEE